MTNERDKTGLVMNNTGHTQMQRITVSIAEAMAISGLSMSTLYRKLNSGELETTTVGRRRLVNMASLKRLLGAE